MGSNREHPRVTVLMPVYNGGRYLRKAIASVLAQSFADFELLIIDDGSTDDSTVIGNSFADPRIRLVRNEQNIGVARSLNKGVDLARGELIARMDADDISLSCRFEKQLSFFEKNPETSVVATRVQLVDADDQDSGVWPDDVATTTYEEIIHCLPRANCIAHPSVMMYTGTARQYRYWEKKAPSQDYNLWLRLAADHVRISKLDDVLLKHRRHAQSATASSNAASFGIKDIHVKARFLLHRLFYRQRMNRFDLQVFGFLLLEFFSVARIRVEKTLRLLARRMLLTVGNLCCLLVFWEPESRLFLFFPFYHTGGAERVHADIVAAVAKQKPWVIITHRSRGDHFRKLFDKNGHLLEVSCLLNNAVTRIICLGYFSAMINRIETPRVFGANAPFFYELLPYLDDRVECIDLVHAFGGGLEDVSLPYVSRLNRRVVVNRTTFDDFQEQYASNGIEKQNLEKISLIENAVAIPATFCQKDRGDRLKVLYVGRGSAEKRVHLVGEIAKLCQSRELAIDFILVGDVYDSIPVERRKYCIIVGEVTDTSELERYYREHDLLLVTSRSEGFPLVIMEAMAHGVVPVCTDVGGISAHVVDGVTGFLIPSGEAEEEITGSFVELLSRLAHNRSLLEEISEQVYRHALEHFGFDRFNRAYRQLLVGNRTQGMG